MSVQEKMTALADAIRSKTGASGSMTLDQMAAAVAGISVGSNDAMRFGFTSSPEVSTGLSSLSRFVFFRKTLTGTGMVYAVSGGNSVSYIYCTSHSDTENICAVGSDGLFTVSGGNFTWNGTGNLALAEDINYYWFACGEA